MKKILIFIALILIGGIAGCTNENPEPVINESNIQDVILLIDLLPTNTTEENRQLVNQIKESYDLLTDAEKVLVTNYEILENAINAIRAIDAKHEEQLQSIKSKLKEVGDVVEANIPPVVSNDITLPVRAEHEELGTVNLSWSSSDPYTLSGFGRYNPGYVSKSVTLTATVYVPGATHTFSKEVSVTPVEFEPLVKGETVFAYAYSTAHGFDEVAKKTINVVNHAFADVVDGELSISGLHDRGGLMSLRKEGIRVVLCIGGYGNGAIPWSKAAKTKEGREKLAASIVENVVKLNYDGVDVDWEYPGFYTDPSWNITQAEDTKNYTLMMQEIRKQLKAVNENYIFSAAVPGGTWGPPRYDVKSLVPVFDYFHLMTYDLDSSTVTTHLTALYSSPNTLNADCSVDGSVAMYLDRGGEAIREKLVVGATFYGRIYSRTSGMRKTAGGRMTVSYHSINRDIINKGLKESWDEVAQAPYIYDEVTNSVYSYDSPRSLIAKSDYIKEQGLAGMMFWEYSQDNTGTLIQAVYDGLKVIKDN